MKREQQLPVTKVHLPVFEKKPLFVLPETIPVVNKGNDVDPVSLIGKLGLIITESATDKIVDDCLETGDQATLNLATNCRWQRNRWKENFFAA